MVLEPGGEIRHQCGSVLAAGLWSGKASCSADTGRAEPLAAGKCSHGGGKVSVYGVKLPGTALFCLPKVSIGNRLHNLDQTAII